MAAIFLWYDKPIIWAYRDADFKCIYSRDRLTLPHRRYWSVGLAYWREGGCAGVPPSVQREPKNGTREMNNISVFDWTNDSFDRQLSWKKPEHNPTGRVITSWFRGNNSDPCFLTSILILAKLNKYRSDVQFYSRNLNSIVKNVKIRNLCTG